MDSTIENKYTFIQEMTNFFSVYEKMTTKMSFTLQNSQCALF